MGIPGGSDGKESACNAEDLGSMPGLGGSLREGVATHYTILAWRISWTEEPGWLQSTGSQRVGHTEWLTLSVSVINSSLSSPRNLDSYLAHKQPQGGKHMLQCGSWLVDLEKEHVGVEDPFHHWILTFRLLELSLEIQHSTYLGWVKGYLYSFKKYFLWTGYEMVR